MRLRVSVFLCGLCLLVMAAGMSVSAGTQSGGGDTVSAGQTVVTAQVMAEETPPDEEETDPPGEKTSESEMSDSDAADPGTQSGVQSGAVDTADASTWEYMFLLLVSSGIVFMALKRRRRY